MKDLTKLGSMRGQFFIEGDKIYLVPENCVFSLSQLACNVSSATVTHASNVIKPIQPLPTMTFSQPSNVPFKLIMSGAKNVNHPTHPNSTISLNNIVIPGQYSNAPSAMIIPCINLDKQPINFDNAMSMPDINKNQSTNNVRSALIMPTTTNTKQFIPIRPMMQSASNVSLSLIRSEPNIVSQPVKSKSSVAMCNVATNKTSADLSTNNANRSIPCRDGISIKDAKNDKEASCKVSPLEYLISSNNKEPDTMFCHNCSCSATATETNDVADIYNEPNNESLREEFEASRNKLNKTVIGNPAERSNTNYQQTIGSQLSNIPDLVLSPHTTYLLKSIRQTLGKSSKSGHSTDYCESPQVDLHVQNPTNDIAKQPIRPILPKTMTPSSNILSSMILSNANINGHSPQSNFIVSSQLSNTPSVLILPMSNILKPIPTPASSQKILPSPLILSKANVREPITTMLFIQSATYFPSSLINSEANNGMHINQSNTSLTSTSNNYGTLPSIGETTFSDDVLMEDATLDESNKASPPEYIKSNGGILMYHSNYLYMASNNKRGKKYYKCRNRSCPGTAMETKGHVVVNHQHNHEPPREEYEALKTKEELIKAMIANPSEKFGTVYQRTISSRLSKVPDLGNYPKAIPIYDAINRTLRRAMKGKKLTARHKSQVKPHGQVNPNDIVTRHIPNTTLSESANSLSNGGVSIRDVRASLQLSPPVYVKSQFKGDIMYYDSYLYVLSKKARGKLYYKCRSKSCRVTAMEVNGHVVVNHQHNHEPPREDYEALVTMEDLKKAVAENPDEKLSTVYLNIMNSRLLKVHDLVNHSKAAPLFNSVSKTMWRTQKRQTNLGGS